MMSINSHGELALVGEVVWRLPTDQEIRVHRAAKALDGAEVGLDVVLSCGWDWPNYEEEKAKAERAVERARRYLDREKAKRR